MQILQPSLSKILKFITDVFNINKWFLFWPEAWEVKRCTEGSKAEYTLKFPPACLALKTCLPLYLESSPIQRRKFRCYV